MVSFEALERQTWSKALVKQRACCALKSDPSTCHSSMCAFTAIGAAL